MTSYDLKQIMVKIVKFNHLRVRINSNAAEEVGKDIIGVKSK